MDALGLERMSDHDNFSRAGDTCSSSSRRSPPGLRDHRAHAARVAHRRPGSRGSRWRLGAPRRRPDVFGGGRQDEVLVGRGCQFKPTILVEWSTSSAASATTSCTRPRTRRSRSLTSGPWGASRGPGLDPGVEALPLVLLDSGCIAVPWLLVDPTISSTAEDHAPHHARDRAPASGHCG